jgi:hypothetical protein
MKKCNKKLEFALDILRKRNKLLARNKNVSREDNLFYIVQNPVLICPL